MRIVIRLCGGLFLSLLLSIAFPQSILYAAPNFQIGTTTTLTMNDNGLGTVEATPSGPTYSYGDVVTLAAVPSAGATFSHWSGDLTSPNDWYASLWDYRVPVNIGANGYPREERPVEVEIDFPALLTTLGASASFDAKSIRVVEIDNTGQIIDNNVVFQFEDTNNDGAGTLIFLLTGTTGINSGRTYHVYFDIVGKGFTAPVFTDSVALADIGKYRGQDTYQVTTNNATYYYHMLGGGFASLDDSDNNDWIDFRTGVSGAGGTFRGIPNMVYPEGEFHPGKSGSTTTVLHSGPLKETIRTQTNDGKWEAIWEFFPTFARMTVLKADHNYWFLYEGTPGGTLETNSDFIVRADGTQTLLSQEWQTDLGGDEWVYISDPGLGRSLFLAHHTNDNTVESYRPLNNLMTVFGFGRQNDPKLATTLNQIPDSFTIGLVDETSYTPMALAIHNAYKVLAVDLAQPQQRGAHRTTVPATSDVVNVTMSSDRTLTANFVALDYELTLQTSGEGTVDATPDQTTYDYNDVVTIEATPATGWIFDGWSGDLSGATNPTAVTINADKTITANFVRIPYTIDLTIVGEGTVNRTPDQPTYFYGDVVTLAATPAVGWHFVEWQGAQTGTDASFELTITDNVGLIARFERNQYSVNTALNGKGTVTIEPDLPTYTHGTEVTLTASPSAGWQFDSWQGDLLSTANPLVLTLTGDLNLTASFKQQFYNLNTIVEAGGAIVISPDTPTYTHGADVTLTAQPEPGWQFVGWRGDAGGTTNPLTITMDRSKSIEASFERIAYTLVVNQVTGGTITWSPVKTTYLYGDEVIFTATAAADHLFAGWSGLLDGDENPAVLTIESDALVSATFTDTPVQVNTATVGQGTVEVTPDQTFYQLGTQVQLSAQPAAGWIFVGWQGDIVETTTPLTVTLTGNLNVTAKFVEANYPVTVVQTTGAGTIAVSPQKESYQYGEEITIVATPLAGYRFVRWLFTPAAQSTITANPLVIKVDSDLVITAEFSNEALSHSIFLPIVQAGSSD